MRAHGRLLRRVARQLPPGLAVRAMQVREDLLPVLLPLRRGGSGAVVFDLAARTLQALRERPAELLQAGLGEVPGYRPWRALRARGAGLVWFSAHRQRPAWWLLVPEEGVLVLFWRERARRCDTLAG